MIDIEREARRVNADGLARKFLSARERAEMATLDTDARRERFLRLWTCKEAMSKATGDALSAPFRDLDVSLDGDPKLLAGPPPYVPSAWAPRLRRSATRLSRDARCLAPRTVTRGPR